ncbi:LysR family transcriptional regulator [Spirillospora sp. CA-294931]|uniref:LysR family transcriptional regulator n=1 Tax=Spirillospora sp. CA-294931 TaxID=3240042 RepID=UPI003D9222B6
MLDVHRLIVLRSVVETGSIQSAASHLGYTPSAISQHVASLQRETGTVLVERHGRGIRPTEAGRLLAGHAREIQGKIADAETALADLRAGKAGRLTVRYFATAGAVLLPRVVGRFGRLFPDVRLELRLSKGLPDGTRDPADAEIMVLRDDRVPPGLRAIPLLDDPYLAVLPAGHPLAGAESVELGRLAREPWVDNEWPSSLCRDTIIEACGAAGFSPDFVVEGHDYATAVAFVAAGLGVTLVPRLALETVPSHGVVRLPVTRPTPTRSVFAVVKEAGHGHPALTAFLDLLREAIDDVHPSSSAGRNG